MRRQSRRPPRSTWTRQVHITKSRTPATRAGTTAKEWRGRRSWTATARQRRHAGCVAFPWGCEISWAGGTRALRTAGHRGRRDRSAIRCANQVSLPRGCAGLWCCLNGLEFENTVFEGPTRKGECFYADHLFAQPTGAEFDSAPPWQRLNHGSRSLANCEPRVIAPTAGPAGAFEFGFVATRHVQRDRELRFKYQAA
jgi:hypothetical protein